MNSHLEKKLENASSTIFSALSWDTMPSNANFCRAVMLYCQGAALEVCMEYRVEMTPLTASASRYIDLGEHGGAFELVVSNANCRVAFPLDLKGRKLIFPVYRWKMQALSLDSDVARIYLQDRLVQLTCDTQHWE